MFYELNQNNSGGSFVVNDKLCHRLFIEADSENEALDKAEELGCYWNGVAKGLDCPCCGDRWSTYVYEIDIEKYSTNGYPAYIYDGIYDSTKSEWERKYRRYRVIKEPEFKKPEYSVRRYQGTIAFDTIEDYAQYMANEHGWTRPDARIFYANGTIKEIYSDRLIME